MGDSGAGEERKGGDLRRSVHQDFGVRVERDFTGPSEFLALGSKTRFSTIRFTMGPAVDAGAAAGEAPPSPEEDVVTSESPSEPPQAASEPPAPPTSEVSPKSLTQRLADLLGLSSNS